MEKVKQFSQEILVLENKIIEIKSQKYSTIDEHEDLREILIEKKAKVKALQE
jgi:hypothetical protein